MDAPNTQRDEWVRRFAVCLLELRPALRAEEANEVALVAFDTANDLAPDDAASVFGDILNAKVPIHDLRRWVMRVKSGPR